MTTIQEDDDEQYPPSPSPSPSGIQAFLLSYQRNVSDRLWKLSQSINNEDAALDTTTTITNTTTPQEQERHHHQQEQQPVDDNSNKNSNGGGDGDDDHHDDALSNEFESLMNRKLGGELRGGFERCALGSSSWVPPSYTRMPYCRQLETWDCGIACYIMMSRWLRLSNSSSNPKQLEWTDTLLPEEVQERQELLQAMGGGESIWTADLVLQIHKRLWTVHCHYLYCSTSMQVTEDYQNLGYYRDSFRNDQSRVAKTFDELKGLRASTLLCSSLQKELQQPQQKQPLSLSCVIHAVCHPDCIAMVLLDNYVLLHSTTKEDVTSTTNMGEEEEEDNYTGHYVLLCGISRNQRDLQSAYKYDDAAALKGLDDGVGEDYCLVLCNPGHQMDPYMFVTPVQFERSWRAKGTDEDIVFIVRRTNE